MGGRTETPSWCALQFDPFEIAVKRKVEVQAALLAISDYIESRGKLIMYRRQDGVLLQLGSIGFTKLVEVPASEFQPARQRITADDGCS
jgi:hypothetical protein